MVMGKFQQFLLTLTRSLHLLILDTVLAFIPPMLLGFLQNGLCAVFRMSPLIQWPDREHLWKATPLSFRKYFSMNMAIIIDCFEIFCDKPSNLLARAATFSTHKHYNTVKYLVGIAPQGVISFISIGWGG